MKVGALFYRVPTHATMVSVGPVHVQGLLPRYAPRRCIYLNGQPRGDGVVPVNTSDVITVRIIIPSKAQLANERRVTSALRRCRRRQRRRERRQLRDYPSITGLAAFGASP